MDFAPTPDRTALGWYAGYDACSYYRIQLPLNALGSGNAKHLEEIWTTSESRMLPADWPNYDVVIAQRTCRAGDDGGPALTWMEACKDQEILKVYEVDDDLFSIDPSNPSFEFFSASEIQNNIKTCAEASDLVTVTTEPLANIMRNYNPNVEVLPNYVEESLLTIPRPIKADDSVIVGWGGSATHSMDFEDVEEVIGATILNNPQSKFATIGGGYMDALPRDRLLRMPWSLATRRAFPKIARFDIGIAPLKKHVFNESKSYIKVLEYAALGIPCIASRFGPYPDFIDNGITGYLVDTPEEWAECLNFLINNEYARRDMGEAARAKAYDYTIQENAYKWEEAYQA